MKANELMQGDLVLYEYNGEKTHARVVEIYRSSALVESVSKEYEPIEIAEDKLFPVAITPEILGKNGFTKSEIKELPDTIEHLNDEESGFARGQQYELTAIEAEILCLQQEQQEVDLETEVEEWWQNWASPPRNEYAVFNKEEFINLARHFYELGLNARKEEE